MVSGLIGAFIIAPVRAEILDTPQTLVAYSLTAEGSEYLQEGYVEKATWQAEFEAQSQEVQQIYTELLDLRNYLSEENAAKIDNFNIANFNYIEELQNTKDEFTIMRDEALAAKERQLEQQRQKEQQQSQPSNTQTVYSGNGSGLTQSSGVNYYNGNKETYYNLDMSGVIANAQAMGIQGNYWVRSDGVKMYGDYVIVAAQMNKGSIIQTSLGAGIVLDWCPAGTIDIATTWG